MKGIAIFISNDEEIENAKSLATKPPKEQYEFTDFYFNISALESSHKDSDGNIVLSFTNNIFSIKNDFNTWEKIVKHFE